MDLKGAQQSMARVAKRYGPIFRFQIMDFKYVIVSDPAYVSAIGSRSQGLCKVFSAGYPVSQLCLDLDFGKFMEGDAIFGPLKQLRGDGLTTIDDGDVWSACQKVVLGGFKTSSLKRYAKTVNCFILAVGRLTRIYSLNRYLRLFSITSTSGSTMTRPPMKKVVYQCPR